MLYKTECLTLKNQHENKVCVGGCCVECIVRLEMIRFKIKCFRECWDNIRVYSSLVLLALDISCWGGSASSA